MRNRKINVLRLIFDRIRMYVHLLLLKSTVPSHSLQKFKVTINPLFYDIMF